MACDTTRRPPTCRKAGASDVLIVMNEMIRVPSTARHAHRGPLLAAVAILASLWACDDDPLGVGRDSDAPVQTDRLAYALERNGEQLETTIGYTYTNTGSDPLFIQNCNGGISISLEKRVQGVWVEVWTSVVPQCLSQAIAIVPGQSITGELLVAAGLPFCQCADPRFTTPNIEGLYRLVFGGVFDAQDGSGFAAGDPVPIDLRLSNRFTLDD